MICGQKAMVYLHKTATMWKAINIFLPRIESQIVNHEQVQTNSRSTAAHVHSQEVEGKEVWQIFQKQSSLLILLGWRTDKIKFLLDFYNYTYNIIIRRECISILLYIYHNCISIFLSDKFLSPSCFHWYSIPVSYDDYFDWFLGMKFDWLQMDKELKCNIHQEAFFLDINLSQH